MPRDDCRRPSRPRPGGRARRRRRLALQRRLRAWVPVWVPHRPARSRRSSSSSSAAAREAPRPPRRRVPPGPEDADLGFGEIVEDERRDPVRAARPPAPSGAAAGSAGSSAPASRRSSSSSRSRSDRGATWQAPSRRTTAHDGGGALHVRGVAHRGAARADPLRRRLRLHRRRQRHARHRVPRRAARLSRPDDLPRALRPGVRGRPARRPADGGRARRARPRGGPPRRGAPRGRDRVPRPPGGGAAGAATRARRRERARRILRTAFAERLSERNVIRAAYALPDELPGRRRARPTAGRRALPVSSPAAASSRAADERDARGPSCSPRTDVPSAFASMTTPLALRLERAARDEERRADTTAPVVELRQGRRPARGRPTRSRGRRPARPRRRALRPPASASPSASSARSSLRERGLPLVDPCPHREGVRERVARGRGLLARPLELVVAFPATGLERREPRSRPFDVRVRGRDRSVGVGAAPVEILALERNPLERLPHARPPARGSRRPRSSSVAHDLELVRDLRVAPLELAAWARASAGTATRRILSVGRDRPTAVRRLAA